MHEEDDSDIAEKEVRWKADDPRRIPLSQPSNDSTDDEPSIDNEDARC